MASSTNHNHDVAHDFFPFFRLYKDGRVESLQITSDIVPAGADDPESGFRFKDVTITADPAVSAGIFIPISAVPNKKLPLLLYVHGGGFCIESAFNLQYQSHVGSLSVKANAVAVSVEYRLAPEHLIPACYHDCWDALRWVAAHVNRDGPEEPWLNEHADFNWVCLAGDSAGANICHHLASRAGSSAEQLGGESGGNDFDSPVLWHGGENRLWKYLCSETSWQLRPTVEDLAQLPYGRVKVFLAEKDFPKVGRRNYVEDLKRSGWNGVVDTVEHGGEYHVLHLKKLSVRRPLI